MGRLGAGVGGIAQRSAGAPFALPSSGYGAPRRIGLSPAHMSRKLSLTIDGKNIAVHLHKDDLPDSVTFNGPVAVDSETMGLSLVRDPLCLVQLSDGGGEAHLVQLDRESYDAPNLKRVLTDAGVLKLFHFARFDVAMFMRDLSVITTPIYCTK